jgi:hypothetical protein
VQYFRWAWHGLGCPAPDLITTNLAFASFQIGSKDWPERMEDALQQSQPDLIVVDTATPCFNVEDENDNGEATKIINNLRRLMALTTPTATCIVLKHAKVRAEDGKYTLRGAKAWEGAVDAVLFQTKQPGRPRRDGLNNTILSPSKVRAFGLREPLAVHPDWVAHPTTGEIVGLRLTRTAHTPRRPRNNYPAENGAED